MKAARSVSPGAAQSFALAGGGGAIGVSRPVTIVARDAYGNIDPSPATRSFKVDAKVKALTALIEPVMIVFVGGIVGFIVIAMYLPMFSLYEKIR